jgi:hypothetical protein
MRADDETPELNTPPVELTGTDSQMDEVIPCIHCGCDLQGLPDGARCPECNTPLKTTFDIMYTCILCPICRNPNRPSASSCDHCGESFDHEDEPIPSDNGFMFMGWLIGGLFITMLSIFFISSWSDEPNSIGYGHSPLWRTTAALTTLSLAAILAVILFFQIHEHLQRRRAFKHENSLSLKKETATETRSNQSTETHE